MRRPANTIGRRGEKVAEKLLKKAGFRIVATNYNCTVGEIDIIALDGDELVFVEVKALQADDQSDDRRDPEDHVNRRKRDKLRQVARHYLHAARAENRPCRFDVVAVVFPQTGNPETRHYKDAF